jgi:hypothetical protein
MEQEYLEKEFTREFILSQANPAGTYAIHSQNDELVGYQVTVSEDCSEIFTYVLAG